MNDIYCDGTIKDFFRDINFIFLEGFLKCR